MVDQVGIDSVSNPASYSFLYDDVGNMVEALSPESQTTNQTRTWNFAALTSLEQSETIGSGAAARGRYPPRCRCLPPHEAASRPGGYSSHHALTPRHPLSLASVPPGSSYQSPPTGGGQKRRTADLYDLLFASTDYLSHAQRVRAIVSKRNPDARSLLDVACGPGRHLEQLGASYKVQGLDADE